jgi:hypothetical protein
MSTRVGLRWLSAVILACLCLAAIPVAPAQGACLDYGEYLRPVGWTAAFLTDAVAISGPYAVLGCPDSLRVVDISAPEAPVRIGALALPPDMNGVALQGAFAYVANATYGLRVVDLGDPAHPVLRGTANTPGRAKAVVLADHYAFVADGTSGLQVIDVADPSAPVIVGAVDTPGDAQRLALAGSLVLVADGSSLVIIDAADPAAPVVVGSIDTPGATVGVAAAGTLAYISDSRAGMEVVDISNPAAPRIVGSLSGPYFVHDIAVSGEYVFLAEEHVGLNVIDVADPSSPSLLTTVALPGWVDDLDIADGVCAVACHGTGVFLIDIAPVAVPPETAQLSTPGPCEGVDVRGRYAYLADGSALRVVDIGNPSLPFVAGSFPASGANNVTVSGEQAYVSRWTGGLTIVSLANPTQPELLAGVSTAPRAAVDAAVWGTRGCVSETDEYDDCQLQVLDVTNPAAPGSLGAVHVAGIGGVAMADDFAYVTGSVGLSVVDLHGYPTLVTIVPLSGAADVAVAGHYAWVAGSYQMAVLDIANPSAPVVVWRGNLPWAVGQISLAAQYAYLALGDGGVAIMDASDPIRPVSVGYINTPGESHAVVCSGGDLLEADGYEGFRILKTPCGASAVLPSDREGATVRIFPSPSAGATRIAFRLDARGPVTLTVHDALGRLVATPYRGTLTAGDHEAFWNGCDAAGRRASDGVYFIRVLTTADARIDRLTLIR